MTLLGNAALAMWWNMAAPSRADFEDWHSHEHFPERLAIPGFRRASRWSAADGGEGIFVLYELDEHETLSSAAYLERLNAPTPWSARLMPAHRDMVRSQCRVLGSAGGAIARHIATVRLSPAAGRADALRAHLGVLSGRLAMRPGLVGAHLLQHETPAMAATTEQKIRGMADRVADWVYLVCAYDTATLQQVIDTELAAPALTAAGAAPASEYGTYTLSYSATPADLVQRPTHNQETPS